MSFWCNDNCKLPGGTGPGICRCCPTAEYYRSQYQIDERGRAFERSIRIPLPVNLPSLDLTAHGFYFSTFLTAIAPSAAVPLNAAATQSFINTALNGEIMITRPGIYSVTYNLFTANGGAVELLANQLPVSGSRVENLNAGIITGSVILNLTSYPTVISLINAGAGAINILPPPNGGASAQLVISQI